jgi:hypothetical protein
MKNATKIIRMKDEVLNCMICGGVMEMTGYVDGKLGRLKRYRCTCGSHVDIKEETDSHHRAKSEPVMPEGIQEFV